MNIDLLYFPGCPNFRITCDLICQIVSERNLDVTLTLKSVDESNVKQFRGSPTVLVNGVDIEECFIHQKLPEYESDLQNLSIIQM